MTNTHPGAPTRPMHIGAPLDRDLTGIEVPGVSTQDIREELLRAEYELLHALARHRKAWAAMRAYGDSQDQKAMRSGSPKAYLDSDPIWKVKTGDVTWWRGEVAAQAAAVTALRSMLPPPEPPAPLDNWAEVTSYGEMAKGQRTFISAHQRTFISAHQTVREIVLSAPPGGLATEAQYNAARLWLQVGGPRMRNADRERCESIVRSWEAQQARS